MNRKAGRTEQNKDQAKDRTAEMTEDQQNTEQDAALDVHAADAIARQLKVTYGELLDEPIPSRFHDLLEKLGTEQRGRIQSSKSSKDEA